MNGKHKLVTIFSALLLMFFVAGLSNSTTHAATSIFIEHQITVEYEDDFYLDFNENVVVKRVTSSNKSVVSVEYLDEDYVELYAEGVGKATITATDSKGNTDTCIVTVKPWPLEFEESEIVFDEYDYEETISVYVNNELKSVKSSNSKIAKAKLDNYEEDGYVWSYIEITPVSAGTASITATDIYGQTATLKVTITQRYIDEMKYLDIFEGCFNDMYYGDTMAYFTASSSDFKGATITATIGGKKYKAVYDGYHDDYYEYVIKNIPVLPVGTAISYTISKGKAAYSDKSEIQKGELDWFASVDLNNDIYVYTYSGKKIAPAETVEYWFNYWEDSKILKRGTDYTVTYTDNLNVGTAKVKVTGKGNYRNSASETFTIIPKGTSITKISKAKKAFKVKWKKQTEKMSISTITGYQIRYSTNKSMSGAPIITVKGYNNTSKKISKLQKKKKYYVQIRTYKTVNGKDYCSEWSAKKSVKTK